ncbi:GNAT family N-acetyltransferase [Streptococcus cuniculipharyngis]|uniref:GNAT family N-acetyltransferase n=2 Tax=Streptococcus cuniculipharyngis TaxID=1562651 RepID=A0A5C5SH68_9STRE|nr:GNAT family N-acetyltransferase [Streptococcus cuniculipharyngis]
MGLRSLTQNDVPALAELAQVLGYPVEEAFVAQQLAQLLVDESHFILGYEKDGQLVGFLDSQVYESLYAPKGFNVLGLVVLPSHQGQGIGRELLTALEEEASNRAFAFIRLNSGSQRLNAHEFYRRCGYEGDKMQVRFFKRIGDRDDF